MFSLGQRIRDIRMKKGLTQTDLAKGLCTPSMISQIETDRARPSYAILSAISVRLETPLDKLLSEVDLDIDTISTYKIAQAMIASGSHAAAIPLLEKLLTMQTSVSTVAMKLGLVECYIQTNQYEPTNLLLSELEDQARLRSDPLLKVAVLYHTGIVYLQKHVHQIAIYHWLQALHTLEALPLIDTEWKVRLLAQVASTYTKLGHLELAIGYQTQAFYLYEEMHDFEQVGHSYLQMSRNYKSLNDLERSSEYAELARGIFKGHEQKLLQLQVQVLNASLQAKAGQETDAIAQLESAIEQYGQMKNSEDAGIAWLELANVYLRQDDLSSALAACEQSRSLLPELHHRLPELHRIRGVIAWKQNARDEALHRLQIAADGFHQAGNFSEWELTISDMASLYAEAQDFPRAYALLHHLYLCTRQTLTERGIVL